MIITEWYYPEWLIWPGWYQYSFLYRTKQSVSRLILSTPAIMSSRHAFASLIKTSPNNSLTNWLECLSKYKPPSSIGFLSCIFQSRATCMCVERLKNTKHPSKVLAWSDNEGFLCMTRLPCVGFPQLGFYRTNSREMYWRVDLTTIYVGFLWSFF